MVAAGITGGNLHIRNCNINDMVAVADRLNNMGVDIEPAVDGCVVSREGPILPADITTQPYPGFPTDLQAQFMAMLALARGNSVITEKIYPDRFLHVAELNRMGANLRKEGPSVFIPGVDRLIAAPIMASDLRASAALVWQAWPLTAPPSSTAFITSTAVMRKSKKNSTRSVPASDAKTPQPRRNKPKTKLSHRNTFMQPCTFVQGCIHVKALLNPQVLRFHFLLFSDWKYGDILSYNGFGFNLEIRQ
jgi:hypothetical protein